MVRDDLRWVAREAEVRRRECVPISSAFAVVDRSENSFASRLALTEHCFCFNSGRELRM